MKDIKFFEEKYFEELDMVMPIVERVHGPHHKEIYEVSKVYKDIKNKLCKNDDSLEEDFLKLREITDGYKVPDDVCETYAKVYKMLENLEKDCQGM
jgi:iron-sulfur cluster repair protein YtfE (RIC family)